MQAHSHTHAHTHSLRVTRLEKCCFLFRVSRTAHKLLYAAAPLRLLSFFSALCLLQSAEFWLSSYLEPENKISTVSSYGGVQTHPLGAAVH